MRAKGRKDVWIERTYDFLVASGSLEGKISKMEVVVEDFESRPHKAMSFEVRREKETEDWDEQKLPKMLPGYSEGRLPESVLESQQKRGWGQELRAWISVLAKPERTQHQFARTNHFRREVWS